MRKLIVLVALSLGALSARAQATTGTVVTKLPGEEKLSVRERAERDFLMPVRRKKATELTKQPVASTEQLTTSAPENDALTNYNEAAPDPRPEAAPETRVASTTRDRATRHAAWLAARRERLAEEHAAERRAEARAEARRATHHSSSKSHSTKAKHTSKSTKASSSKSKASKTKHHAEETHHSKKATTHKATKSRKVETTKRKAHSASTKVKTKAKPASHKKRR